MHGLPRLDWIYRFNSNHDNPNSVEEIDFLSTLDTNDSSAYLLLANRSSPALISAKFGNVVGLCTSHDRRLILHGTAVVAGECIRSNTPQSVLPIYGELPGRVFCPLKDLERLRSNDLPNAVLDDESQKKFLEGRAFVKRLHLGIRSSRKSAVKSLSRTDDSLKQCQRFRA